SLNGVRRNGRGVLSPSRGRTQRSSPVERSTSQKRRALPSGEKEYGNWGLVLVVKRSSGPLPSANLHQRLRAPPPEELQAMRLPSRVQTGWSSSSSNVRRVRIRRPSSYTHTSNVNPWTVMATRRPSGESAGSAKLRRIPEMGTDVPL